MIDVLNSLSSALNSSIDQYKSMMSQLSDDQKIAFNEFQVNYAKLIKAGDSTGAIRLIEELKKNKAFNDKL